MIKIEHPKLHQIANNYFDWIKSDIIERCDFYLNVANVIDERARVEVLANHPLNGNTKRSLLNNFLVPHQRLTSIHQIAKFSRPNFLPWAGPCIRFIRELVEHFCVEENLRLLILCSATEMESKNNEIQNLSLVDFDVFPEMSKVISSIFDYSLFEEYAYKLATALEVNTCPYCNRNYINAVVTKSGRDIIRPTFDHFLPKSRYPFFALNFYNLIPSCYHCNSNLKGAHETSLSTHLHPYIDGFGKKVIFKVDLVDLMKEKSNPENYKLYFQDQMQEGEPDDIYRLIFGGSRMLENREEGNINLFELHEIYQFHRDVVGELRVKVDKLNSSFGSSVVALFPPESTNIEEFYLYYFGNYLNEANFNRRPMAKLTRDIVAQLYPFL